MRGFMVLRPYLRRFWFEFDLGPTDRSWPLTVLRLGCGCTGYDQEDCLRLISECVMGGEPVPPIKKVVPDVDIRTLDANHVRRGVGVVAWRGIWLMTVWMCGRVCGSS